MSDDNAKPNIDEMTSVRGLLEVAADRPEMASAVFGRIVQVVGQVVLDDVRLRAAFADGATGACNAASYQGRLTARLAPIECPKRWVSHAVGWYLTARVVAEHADVAATVAEWLTANNIAKTMFEALSTASWPSCMRAMLAAELTEPFSSGVLTAHDDDGTLPATIQLGGETPRWRFIASRVAPQPFLVVLAKRALERSVDMDATQRRMLKLRMARLAGRVKSSREPKPSPSPASSVQAETAPVLVVKPVEAGDERERKRVRIMEPVPQPENPHPTHMTLELLLGACKNPSIEAAAAMVVAHPWAQLLTMLRLNDPTAHVDVEIVEFARLMLLKSAVSDTADVMITAPPPLQRVWSVAMTQPFWYAELCAMLLPHSTRKLFDFNPLAAAALDEETAAGRRKMTAMHYAQTFKCAPNPKMWPVDA